MQFARRAATAVVLILLIAASGAVRAQTEFKEIDWADVKRRWGAFSPAEQAKLWEIARSARRTTVGATPKASGDDCDEASPEPSTLPILRVGDTTAFLDALNPQIGCGNGIAGTGLGPDQVFEFVTSADCTLDAIMTPATNLDLALYVVDTDCSDVDANCIALDDDGGPGTIENVTFDAIADTSYYVVVDGFAGSAGAFSLEIRENGSTGCTLA